VPWGNLLDLHAAAPSTFQNMLGAFINAALQVYFFDC
jgi:hypothetical protein